MTPTALRTLPPELRAVKTMLSEQELGLLFALARDTYTGRGDIIDGGAFLGGSTLALTHGLLANGRVGEKHGRVHSYDYFVADDYTAQFIDGYPVGSSTRPYYDRVVEPVAPLLRVHEGDITTFPWPADRAIEILFIDVAKSWAVNDFLLHHFFPALIPGVSHVIQQDYHWPHTPWISITMELLADHFEYVESIPWATAVYRCTRAPARSRIPPRLLDVGADTLRRLAARAQRWDRGSREWAAQQCNIVSLCQTLGQTDDAAEVYKDVVNAAGPWVDYFGYQPDPPLRT